MTVSSRTPEGFPSHCPLCGARVSIELSDPAGDAPCPKCGSLLRLSAHFIDALTKHAFDLFGSAPDQITTKTSFKDFNVDSLEFVELVMALEDKYDIQIPDKDFNQIQTLGDLMRFMKFKGHDSDSSE